VAVRKGVITVSVTNFQFSRPTISVKVKPALWKKTYKKAAEANRKKAKG
jgi:tetrahydromethanopterin S-methyltransferase subunit C